MSAATMTLEQYESALRSDPEFARLDAELDTPYRLFEPRPDHPDIMDEQTGFSESDARVCVVLGGTGSGKTIAAACKAAKFIRETVPPRIRTPYWVIGETYELVCGVAWVEKLSTLIPDSMFFGEPDWYRKTRGWPYAVNLKHPTIPGAVGWVLEFKSFKQGRERLQAASIGGAWFNEQAPLDLVHEVKGRTRDYNSQLILDFTPLKPDIEWPKVYRKPPPGWKFFHLNSKCNTALPDGWVDEFLDGIPTDSKDTRQYGLFASFRGAVFKDFRHDLHVVKPFDLPAECRRHRGIDFGYTAPFACVWVARLPRSVPLPDGRIAREGTWVCYREHIKAETMLHDHAAAINDAEEWGDDPNVYGTTVADHDSQDAAELKALGVFTIPADKSPYSVDAGIYAMKKLMLGGTPLYAPKFLVFETCETLIDELQAYKYDEGSANRDPLGIPIKKDDHGVDALRYSICEGMRSMNEFPSKDLEQQAPAPWRTKSGGFLGAASK